MFLPDGLRRNVAVFCVARRLCSTRLHDAPRALNPTTFLLNHRKNYVCTGPSITTHKFVAVLNKKIPIGSLINALGHMTAGLSVSYSNIPEMRFDSYFDKNGGEHKSISDNPFIILAADNSNKIRTLRNQLLANGIHFVDFKKFYLIY